MSEFNEQIRLLLTDAKNRKKIVGKQLSQCPYGRMIMTNNHDKKTVMQIIGEGASRIRKYITKNEALQVDLARRAMLENEEAHLELVIDILSNADDLLSNSPEDDRLRFLLKTFPWLSKENIEKAMIPDPNLIEWEQAQYDKSDYYNDYKTKITSRGLAVRSKSELLIAEMLYKYNVAFRYEQIFYTGDGVSLIPDFTIKKSDGTLVIWEHEGLTNSEDYLNWQKQKGNIYASYGYFPWKNLIVTYDNENGDIDLRIIESEIVNKLL